MSQPRCFFDFHPRQLNKQKKLTVRENKKKKLDNFANDSPITHVSVYFFLVSIASITYKNQQKKNQLLFVNILYILKKKKTWSELFSFRFSIFTAGKRQKKKVLKILVLVYRPIDWKKKCKKKCISPPSLSPRVTQVSIGSDVRG